MARDDDRPPPAKFPHNAPHNAPGKSKPVVIPRGQQLESERRQREAVALRENLARRKAQQRTRRLAPSPPSASTDKTGD
jgi:hypothetical protein